MNFDSARPFIAKILAPLVGLLITAINKKWGISYDDTVAQQAVATLTDLIVFAISTGISAVFINKQVNPGNAASSHLAGAEADEAQKIKVRADALNTPNSPTR